jgi:hypothetical protein
LTGNVAIEVPQTHPIPDLLRCQGSIQMQLPISCNKRKSQPS